MERIAVGALAALVLAQGGYTFKLQRNLRALSERLDQPSAVTESAESARPALPNQVRLAPAIPRLTTAPSPAAAVLPPVLEALGTPEARQKLQAVLGAMKEEKRREKLVESVERREKIDQKVKELMGPELGLNADESARVSDLLTRAATARRHAVEELASGARSRADAKNEIDGAQKAADQELEKVLGEKRLASYKTLRKKAAQ
jgi:hypothetical protein